MKMSEETFEVVFLRHGESAWNNENLFCGWVDVDLSDTGVKEAQVAGQAIKAGGYQFDIVFTSELKRAYRTTDIVLQTAFDDDKSKWPEVRKSLQLIERHYGELTGRNKAQMVKEHGAKQIQIWRRTYDIRPPPMEESHPCYERIVTSPIFASIPKSEFPKHESLKDLFQRAVPFWLNTIVPEVSAGKRVCIIAHGTSLRALVKHIKEVDDIQINQLNIPNGIPFVLKLDKTTYKSIGEMVFLADEETVKTATEKVAKISMN